MIQLTFKYEKQTFVFDGISSKARCSDLLPRLTALLGPGIPANVRLMQNGRFIRMHQTIEEVRQRVQKSSSLLRLLQSCTCSRIHTSVIRHAGMGTLFWKLFHAGLEVKKFSCTKCCFLYGNKSMHMLLLRLLSSVVCIFVLLTTVVFIRNEVVLGEAECSGFRKLFGGKCR